MDERMFPLQCEKRRTDICSGIHQVPWSVAEQAYRQYARHYGTRQSLETLSQRGGFGEIEFYDLLAGGTGDGRALKERR
jgi:hypothetical protein